MKALTLVVLSLLLWSCEGPPGPPGRDAVDLLTDPSIQPKVIYSVPPQNSVGPYEDITISQCGFEYCYPVVRLQVRFNKYMNLGSVRSAIRINSATGDLLADSLRVMPLSNDHFLIYPIDSNGYAHAGKFGIQRQYRLFIDSSAKDINGNALIPPFEMTFVPEPYFRVINVYPRDGMQNVQTSSYLNIQFNSEIDTSINSFISVSPPLVLRWDLGYDNRALLTPLNKLVSNTRYTVTINANAHDMYGNSLTAPLSFAFTSQAFQVVSISPYSGRENVPTNMTIEIGFSEQLRSQTARPAFTIHPEVKGTVVPVENRLYFTASPTFADDTEYTVSIDTTLRSMSGEMLASPFVSKFRTERFLLRFSYPQDGTVNVGPASSVELHFTRVLDTASARRAITILPPVAGNFGLSMFDTKVRFYPTDNLLPDSHYVITIDSSLRTVDGGRFGGKKVITFHTGSVQITRSVAENDYRGFPIRNVLYIYTNALVDSTSLRQSIVLRDSAGTIIPGGFYPSAHRSTTIVFDPTDNLAPNTLYTISVSNGLRAIGGFPLKEPYSCTFRTGD